MAGRAERGDCSSPTWVYSEEFGFSVAMMAVMSTSAGILIDKGVSPFGLAAITGAVMLIPAVAWLFRLRLWQE